MDFSDCFVHHSSRCKTIASGTISLAVLAFAVVFAFKDPKFDASQAYKVVTTRNPKPSISDQKIVVSQAHKIATTPSLQHSFSAPAYSNYPPSPPSTMRAGTSGAPPITEINLRHVMTLIREEVRSCLVPFKYGSKDWS